MSITALVVLAVYFGGLVAGLAYQPLYAVFSYLWIFYNDPATRWWGSEVPDVRYSLLAAAVALVGTLRMREKGTVSWGSFGASRLLLAYALWMWIQTPWALTGPIHTEGAILFTKYAVLSYVIYRVTADEKRFELFLWAHVGGCFLFGWEAFKTHVTGRLETIGGPGVDDANLLAAHVITGLVIAGFMFVGYRDWRRWVVLGMLPFILNAVVLTQSRGGFLALGCTGVWAWLTAPKVYRRFVTTCCVLGAALLLMLGDEAFWDRVSTLLEPTDEIQQETRLQLIAPQLQMFYDYPLGAGHRGNEYLSREYMPPELLAGNTGTRSAHNTFMAALVDQGFPGAVLLVLLYGWGFMTLRRLGRLDALGLPPQLALYRAALGSALVSLFVSGMFLNLLKTEVQIWLVALLCSLVTLSEKAIAERGSSDAAGLAEGRPSPTRRFPRSSPGRALRKRPQHGRMPLGSKPDADA